MLSDKIKELYKITNELEEIYPSLKFTINGHFVGQYWRSDRCRTLWA